MNFGRRSGALTIALLVTSALGCDRARARQGSSEPALALSPCHLTSPGYDPVDAKCGTVDVWEDRDAKRGRRISLRVAVVPTSAREPAADALVVLAGGPGQGATQVYAMLASALARVHEARDVVLVDQRGTGASHPLQCEEVEVDEAPEDPGKTESWSRECRTRLEADADLRMYSTRIAADDLDDVRAALGYESIDLYGGSYGTRAALVYARRYPTHVRAMILDGVAPPDWALGESLGSDAQRALDGLFAECARDPACARAFPDLPGDLARLLHRLDAGPVDVVVPHPTTAIATKVHFTRSSATSAVRALSYERETAALIPLLVHDAATSGDVRMLAAQLLLWRDAVQIANGMHLAVVCSEDAPFVDPAKLAAEKSTSYVGDAVGQGYVKACQGWPRAAVDDADRAPVVSDVPTLLLSGELDPVTPPSNAAAAARTLRRSIQIVVPGSGHGALTRGCVSRIAADFLARGTTDGVETSCVPKTHDVRFFTSFTGPPP